ncbi:MAG: DUF4157 domain-containing protein [Cyanobacteria bacterium SBC]|nr:DUF4157 domain-containing protein [Cyanobacteria bacterium SBC]
MVDRSSVFRKANSTGTPRTWVDFKKEEPHRIRDPFGLYPEDDASADDEGYHLPTGGFSILNSPMPMHAPVQRQEKETEEPDELVQRETEDEKKDLEIQTKLSIGQPGDKYEQEADAMASKVMAMPDSAVQRETMPEEEEETLQTKPQLQREAMPEEDEEETVRAKPQLQREAMPEEEDEETLQTKPQLQREAMEEEEDEETLQAKPDIQAKEGATEAPANFDSQLAQHKGSGRPLSDETRSFMEPRFGADFSDVRVHETPDLANAIQAQAFTHGQDIYFNSGKYNPESSGGKELLAHELTHVLQQSSSPGNIQCDVSPKKPRRFNYAFIMGEDKRGNPFYRNATTYFQKHLSDSQIITEARSLKEIFSWLQKNLSGKGKLRHLYIVSHANADGTLSFSIGAGDKDSRVTYGELKKALKEDSKSFYLHGLVDKKTRIHIEGCNLGRSNNMLNLLDKAFGGHGTVKAPKHKQGYTSRGTPLFTHYFIELPGNVRLTGTQKVNLFKEKYNDLGFSTQKWNNLVRKARRKRSIKFTFYTYGPEKSDSDIIQEAEDSLNKKSIEDPDFLPSRKNIYEWRVKRSNNKKNTKIYAYLETTTYIIKKPIKNRQGQYFQPDSGDSTYYGQSTYEPR